MSKIIFFMFITIFTLALKANDKIIIQSTTSLKNSGFYEYILPFMYKDLKIKANVVAVGSGAAIRNSMNCDGDLLIVHSPPQEDYFIKEGYAYESLYIMHNHFIVIGPSKDPAKINNINNIETIFKNIFKTKSKFVSRGDSSGTDFKEKAIWQKIKLNPIPYSGKWYLETGTNMGSTINTAVGLNAYTFTDKATWIAFSNKKDFKVFVENEINLINEYSGLIVNKDKCPFTKHRESKQIIDWLLSKKAKNLIINFKKNGEQLFFIK